LLTLLGARHIFHISRIRVKETSSEDVKWIELALELDRRRGHKRHWTFRFCYQS